MKGIIDQKILSSLKLIFKKKLTKFIWNSNQKKFIFEKYMRELFYGKSLFYT
jgi:hypothetical protein